jgi:hypothetical protein
VAVLLIAVGCIELSRSLARAQAAEAAAAPAMSAPGADDCPRGAAMEGG